MRRSGEIPPSSRKTVRWADSIAMARAVAQRGLLYVVREYDANDAPLAVAAAPTLVFLAGIKRKTPLDHLFTSEGLRVADENAGPAPASPPTGSMASRRAAGAGATGGRYPIGSRMFPMKARQSPSPSPPHTPSAQRDAARAMRIERAELDAIGELGREPGPGTGPSPGPGPGTGPGLTTAIRRVYGGRTGPQFPTQITDASRGADAVAAAARGDGGGGGGGGVRDVSQLPRRPTRSFVQLLIGASPAAMRLPTPTSSPVGERGATWRFELSPITPSMALTMQPPQPLLAKSTSPSSPSPSPSPSPASIPAFVLRVPLTGLTANLAADGRDNRLLERKRRALALLAAIAVKPETLPEEPSDASSVEDTDGGGDEGGEAPLLPLMDMDVDDDGGGGGGDDENLTPPSGGGPTSSSPRNQHPPTSTPQPPPRRTFADRATGMTPLPLSQPQTLHPQTPHVILPPPLPAAVVAADALLQNCGVTLVTLAPFSHPTPDGMLPQTPVDMAVNGPTTRVGPLWLLTTAGREWAAARFRGEVGVPVSPRWRDPPPTPQVDLSIAGIDSAELGLGPLPMAVATAAAAAVAAAVSPPPMPSPAHAPSTAPVPAPVPMPVPAPAPVPMPVPAPAPVPMPVPAPAPTPTLVLLPVGFTLVPITTATLSPLPEPAPPPRPPTLPPSGTPDWFARYEALRAAQREDHLITSSRLDPISLASPYTTTAAVAAVADEASAARSAFAASDDAKIMAEASTSAYALALVSSLGVVAPNYDAYAGAGDGGWDDDAEPPAADTEIWLEAAAASGSAAVAEIIIEAAQVVVVNSRKKKAERKAVAVRTRSPRDDDTFDADSIPRDTCVLLDVQDCASEASTVNAARAKAAAGRAASAGPFCEGSFLPFAFRLDAGEGAWAPPILLALPPAAAERERAAAVNAGRTTATRSAFAAAAAGYYEQGHRVLPLFYEDAADGAGRQLWTYSAPLATAPHGSGRAFERAIAGLAV